MDNKASVNDIAFLDALYRCVPRYLASAILENPTASAIAPRIVNCTTMYADLVGFTPLCEHLASRGTAGLSQLSTILDHLFSALVDDAILPFDGQVVQFGGDSVTAFFEGTDHRRDALAAALYAQQQIALQSKVLKENTGYRLELRVGLASGSLRLPIVGDLTRRVIVCAGPTAHRALTLQNHCPVGKVRVDENILKYLHRVITVSTEQDSAFHAHSELNSSDLDQSTSSAVIESLSNWPERRPIGTLFPLLDHVSQSDADAQIAMLKPFVASALVTKMASTPRGWTLPAELRHVVVLFSELWGLDTKETPADPALVINLSRSIRRAFRRYGGSVTKVDIADKGHRTMIVFGLYRPHENDEERAIVAAMEAINRVRGFVEAEHREVAIRMGIHSGNVFYGAIGSKFRYDITVVGDTVNTAARIGSAGNRFEVNVSDTVAKICQDSFLFDSSRSLQLKGKAAPTTLHRVLGLRQGAARALQTRAEARISCGRESEQQKLQTLLAETLAHQSGAVILLEGNAGAGKSHALAPVVDYWNNNGGVSFLSRCRFVAQNQPLAPVIETLESIFGLRTIVSQESAFTGHSKRGERIRKALKSFHLTEGVEEITELLEPIFVTGEIKDRTRELDSRPVQERTLGAICHLFEALSKSQPLLFIMEDLHLADPLTLELAARIGQSLNAQRAVLLLTYRPSSTLKPLLKQFYSGTVTTSIRLKTLSLTETTKLILAHHKCTDVLSDLALFIWQRSQGNPRHTIDLLQHLEQHNMIKVIAGTLQTLSKNVAQLQSIISPSVRYLATQKLDLLGALPLWVARVGSVLGDRFSGELVQHLVQSKMSTPEVLQAFELLEQLEVLSPSSHSQSGYLFRDYNLRAMIYGMIPQHLRQLLHQQVAQHLEKEGGENQRGFLLQVAHHHEQGGNIKHALAYYADAAHHASNNKFDDQAASLARRWERLTEQLEQAERPSLDIFANMLRIKFMASTRRGLLRQTLRYGRELKGLYWQLFDQEIKMEISFGIAHALYRCQENSVRAAKRYQHVFKNSRQRTLKLAAAMALAKLYRQERQLDDAMSWTQKAQQLTQNPITKSHLTILETDLNGYLGVQQNTYAIYNTAYRLGVTEGDLALRADAARAQATIDLLTGQHHEAQCGFEALIKMYRSLGAREDEARALSLLGLIYLYSDRPKKAINPLAQALKIAIKIGDKRIVVISKLGIAICSHAKDTSIPLETLQKLLPKSNTQLNSLMSGETEMLTTLLSWRYALATQDKAEEMHWRLHAHDIMRNWEAPLYRKEFDRLNTLYEQQMLAPLAPLTP